MNWLINLLFDYHFVRLPMVTIYFFFGYQKWFDYEVKELMPFCTHGPLIFWMYAVFGMKGSFLGVSEWLFGALLLAGFWNKKLGVLGLSDRSRSFYAPSRSFLLCPMAGTNRLAAFRPWSVMLRF